MESPQNRVLIVDDDAVTRKVLSAQLGRLNLHCELASGGRECLSMLGQGFGLILLDCNMPDWDGFTTCLELRRAGYLGPIIGLSADQGDAIRERCLAAGMSDYRSKPLQSRELQSALEQHIQWSMSPQVEESFGRHPLERVRSLAQASGNPGLQEKLVSSFLKSTEEALARLEVALEGNDSDEALAVTHRMKGSAGTFGAFDFGDLAGEAERQLRGRGLEAAAPSLRDLLQAWPTLRAQIRPTDL